MHHVTPAFLALLVASAVAQAPIVPVATAAPAKRTLADGLVRHLIEQERLRPPRVESGLEPGAGTGPLVLLIRRTDGSLQLHEIDRGGDHGPAAEKTNLRDGTGAPQVPAPNGAKQLPGEQPGPAAAPATPPSPATVTLRRDGQNLVLGTAASPAAVRGPTLERGALRTFLQQQAATTRGTAVAGQLVLQVDAEVPMQEVLTVWEVARDSGFTTPMWSPQGKADGSARAGDRELVRGLAAKFEWSVRYLPPGNQPVADGELLVLLDGAAIFGEIAPLLRECALAGLWQISFLGMRDARTRVKLPSHLPFDG